MIKVQETMLTIEHYANRRFELAEPITLDEGRWMSRYSMPGRGYWLPWRIDSVSFTMRNTEVNTAYRGERHLSPAIGMQGIGVTITKTGRPGMPFRSEFRDEAARRESRPVAPAELIELREFVLAELIAHDTYRWPAEGWMR